MEDGLARQGGGWRQVKDNEVNGTGYLGVSIPRHLKDGSKIQQTKVGNIPAQLHWCIRAAAASICFALRHQMFSLLLSPTGSPRIQEGLNRVWLLER